LTIKGLARGGIGPRPKPLVINNLQQQKKNKKKRIKGLTCSNFCAILFPVSERKTMNLFKKNQMTLKEIERFMDAKRKREAKTRENLKRIGEAAAIAVVRRHLPNIV